MNTFIRLYNNTDAYFFRFLFCLQRRRYTHLSGGPYLTDVQHTLSMSCVTIELYWHTNYIIWVNGLCLVLRKAIPSISRVVSSWRENIGYSFNEYRGMRCIVDWKYNTVYGFIKNTICPQTLKYNTIISITISYNFLSTVRNNS